MFTELEKSRKCISSPFINTGIDLVKVDDMKTLMPDPVGVLVTEHEWLNLLDSSSMMDCLAGKFAAKEAVMKVIGKGIDEIDLTDIEILRTNGEKPKAYLSGKALEHWSELGFSGLDISISHHNGHAAAIAVALKNF